MKRSAPLQRRTRLKARSAKTERAYAGASDTEGRRAFVVRILTDRPTCEAHDLLVGAKHFRAAERCGLRSVDVHEVLRRSAGGSIVDDVNVRALCRSCHQWVHEHPKEARDLGLLASRFAPPPDLG